MGLSRRAFLFLTGGSSAAWAAEPGRKMINKLIPYVNPPENIKPGTWQSYASTCRECPAGCGTHLRHRDGRITKAEGNPAHPVNGGGLCARGQSALQGLYDPDRLRQPVRRDSEGKKQIVSWEHALGAITADLQVGGKRAVLISDLQTGSLAEVMQQFVTTFGNGPFVKYEPFNFEGLRKANQQLFGVTVVPRFELEQCDFILSFSCDFLETWLSPVEFARSFGRFHNYEDGGLGTFCYVGPRLSMTAGSADEFHPVSPGRERFVALAMIQTMLDQGWVRSPREPLQKLVSDLGGQGAAQSSGLSTEQILSLAKRFATSDASVALPGEMCNTTPKTRQETALAVMLLNLAAGRIGKTVNFSTNHAVAGTATYEGLNKILSGLNEQDVLFIHGCNPVFTLPSCREQIKKAGTVIHLTTLPDETGELADWLLPLDAPAESWGDYSPWSGIEGLLQPAMTRLHNTRSGGDILMAIAAQSGSPLLRRGSQSPPANFHEWVKSRWQEIHRQLETRESFEGFWREARRGGGIWLENPADSTELKEDLPLTPSSSFNPQKNTDELSLLIYPSIFYFDGRTANRGWLQESPDPISTSVWGSWLDLHPETAGKFGLRQGDVAILESEHGRIQTPVRITEDIVEHAAAIPSGQGHDAPGLKVAGSVGANPFALLGPAGSASRITLERSGAKAEMIFLSATQHQHEREIVKSLPYDRLLSRQPEKGEDLFMPLPEGYSARHDLYKPHEHSKHRWAMAVDLQRCIGCGACAVACYAENNIAVVGPDNAAQGLEMAWLKAVPYRADEKQHRVSWVPMLCQHCDAAPCEPVCPVYASVHNEEGLNAQIYNRCIGTRYCSNNCPYKVRRFNWINPEWEKPLDLQLNPEVTVRCRGVMEKCTFCVQRIRLAEYRAMRENRPLRDGEIVPACQQTCPTGVFTFGDLLDPESRVSLIFRQDPRRYQLLRELNTKTAVVYLKVIRQEGKA